MVADDLPRLLVEIGRLPAAVLEPPLTVLVGRAGPLQDPSNDVNMLTTSSPMTSSSMAVTSSGLTTRPPETYRPTGEGGRRLPLLGRLPQDLVAGARRGREGAQTPRLVVLEGLR